MQAIRRNRWISIVAVVCIAIGPRFDTAEAEVQVNTYTTGRQSSPSVAMDADGNFVVVWHSEGSSGTDPTYSVQGQRYAANGDPVGGEFQVNTFTTDSQGDASVAMDADGDFVVVWFSLGSGGTDSDSSSIQGQCYAANGEPVGDEFQINTYTTGRQFPPSVAMGADGAFVVVWSSENSFPTDKQDSIQGQRYAADGCTAVGDEFQVNTYTTSYQRFPSVAMDVDGGFVVVWASSGSSGTDTSGTSIQGQRYAANGEPVASEFQVNTLTTPPTQTSPSVASDSDGDFVITWDSGYFFDYYFAYNVKGQRFASNGDPVDDEFLVNTYTTDVQRDSSVAMNGDEFVVVWHGPSSDGYGIQGRRYAADGSAIGGEIQVSTGTTGGILPAVAMGADGDFVAVWTSFGSSGTDTSGDSIQMRLLTVGIFADGFESGDTSAWTSAVVNGSTNASPPSRSKRISS